MKETGTLELITYANKRKMNYVTMDGKLYMFTNVNTKKITEIQENDQVTINLATGDYTARLITDKTEMEPYMVELLKLVPKIIKFFKSLQKNAPEKIVIELTKN